MSQKTPILVFNSKLSFIRFRIAQMQRYGWQNVCAKGRKSPRNLREWISPLFSTINHSSVRQERIFLPLLLPSVSNNLRILILLSHPILACYSHIGNNKLPTSELIKCLGLIQAVHLLGKMIRIKQMFWTTFGWINLDALDFWPVKDVLPAQ